MSRIRVAPVRRIALCGFALLLAGAASAFPVYIPPPVAIEFVNDVSGHYVMLRDPAEIAGVESGTAGPGWRRTGYSFVVQLPREGVADGNVCRFYAPRPNTHFYTAHAAECEWLKASDPGWIFEKIEFSAALAYGNCELLLQPVYRLYNGRWRQDDSNHRYTPDPAVRAAMMAQGWVDEGIAFCTRQWWHAPPTRSFAVTAGKLGDSVSQCEDERLGLGPCVGLNQLPAMPNAVTRYLPPWWVEPNPAFPLAAEPVTGLAGAHQLQTPYAIADKALVAARSFVQTNGAAALFGIHVSARDRTRGELASINPLWQFSTAAPPPGQPDARLFPWGDGRDRHLEVAFELAVARLRRGDPQSHAYGHPTLELIDRASGEHLYVTLGAYGSVSPDDFVARDTGTGRVIVATIFRADPAFGTRLAGAWIHCYGAGPCSSAARTPFRFRIDRAAFQRILELARGVNPALSPDPAEYLLDNFHFNNEVVRDAEIGVTLADFRLELVDR